MQGSLGEKIGQGAFSDVHTWAPGQVVKLFKSGVPRRLGWHEARVTRAVFAAGAPAPEVFGEVSVEGALRHRAVSLRGTDPDAALAQRRHVACTNGRDPRVPLHVRSQDAAAAADVLSLRDWLAALQLSGGSVPKHIATGILTLIERVRPEDGLCHADLHPGNVIMTADGPRLVDWTGAVRAPAAFDLACGHITLVEVAPEFIDDPQRPRAYNAAAQSEYARLAGMSPAALTAVMETYLPIACVINLLRGAGGALRER